MKTKVILSNELAEAVRSSPTYEFAQVASQNKRIADAKSYLENNTIWQTIGLLILIISVGTMVSTPVAWMIIGGYEKIAETIIRTTPGEVFTFMGILNLIVFLGIVIVERIPCMIAAKEVNKTMARNMHDHQWLNLLSKFNDRYTDVEYARTRIPLNNPIVKELKVVDHIIMGDWEGIDKHHLFQLINIVVFVEQRATLIVNMDENNGDLMIDMV